MSEEFLIRDPFDSKKDERTEIVVRLRTNYWHDNDGAYKRTSLKYLKRQTKGFNVFDDDCSMVGAEDVVSRIVNLSQCKDGIYQLVTCNAYSDWETGLVEDWDYKLVPIADKTKPQDK